ncbi:TPA: hypothetical protein ACH3X3_007949 [Trebouxia sp. C0006]
MASSADIDSWKALGGKVDQSEYIAPTGESFKSWNEAAIYLDVHMVKENVATNSKRHSRSDEPDQKTANKKARLQAQRPAKKDTPADKPAVKARHAKATSNVTSNAPKAAERTAAPADPQNIVVGSGRQAAQGVEYKEKASLSLPDSKVLKKEEHIAADEIQALDKTKSEGEGPRRLTDFQLTNEQGEKQGVESINIDNSMYITGCIHAATGPMKRESAWKVAKFGPVTAWSLNCDANAVQVLVATNNSEYQLVRPAASYKKIYNDTLEQAEILYEVCHALHPKYGGRPDAELSEVAAKLSRAKVGKSYSSAKEAIIMTGNFLLEQLQMLDNAAGGKATFAFGATAFATSLITEVNSLRSHNPNGGISITERSATTVEERPSLNAEEKQQQADADYARQLQAKLDAQEARGGPRRTGGKQQVYIKISEAEIADDYPEPKQYDKVDDEMDELVLMDEDAMDLPPEDLPRRVLSDFAVYNSEGFCSSLELLPMWSGVDPDVDLYASGNVLDDDGEWAGGQALNADNNDEAAAGGSSGGAGPSGSTPAAGGMRLYLSQIREWIVEFSCDMLFISMRTDVAWYRLSQPATEYGPWFATVLKTCRVAVKVIHMLVEEARASRLSFSDILKRLTALPPTEPIFISKQLASVERFVVVHGQILLNQFKHFPNKAIQSCAFVNSLKTAMEACKHSKLYSSTKKSLKSKSVNRNPMQDRACGARAKPMTATATSMVKAIWQSYFPSTAAEDEAVTEAVAAPVNEDLNEEEDEAAEENALAETAATEKKAAKGAAKQQKVTWLGSSQAGACGEQLYRSVKIASLEVAVGDIVVIAAADDEADEDAEPPLGLLQAVWQTAKGTKEMQVRLVARGCETVLGDAASESELFLTSDLLTSPVQNIQNKIDAQRLQRPWSLSDRRQQLAEDEALRKHNADAKANGTPLRCVWHSLYLPEQGMFCQAPADLHLGHKREEADSALAGTSMSADGKTLIKDGVSYQVGDQVYVHPETFDQLEQAAQAEVPDYAAKGRFHKGGTNAGLRAWGVGEIVNFGAAGRAKQGQVPAKVTLKRFYRPEDISIDTAYRANLYELYASDETQSVEVDSFVGKCSVGVEASGPGEDRFTCTKQFDRKSKKLSDSSSVSHQASSQPTEPKGKGKGKASAVDKGKSAASGKGKGAVQEEAATASDRAHAEDDGIALRTMDIFAGCGGLSEGFQQARAAVCKWAIEYEHPAAEAFKLNHPEAHVMCNNCNVILTAAMHKAGLQDICKASPEAEEEAKALSEQDVAQLPVPGEVDFLCGGPPCQGYSGMNRFNKGNWSMVQNSMVMSYLSYCDLYRPRYFLLENVRNFVSHNKSFTFRLTVRSLLDMGYQVRFGVLNAGNFGVSQSRKRTFIWGVAPGNILPEWPKPQHVFRSSQLTINLPGNVQFTAVPQSVGAPLRTVTVRDVISDLPVIENGHDQADMQYAGPPVSAFQKKIRGECTVLRDHICKQMNELNLERCRCIPKEVPGADWRCLEHLVAQDPAREMYKGQALVPWCLPNTAERHNGWRGLFGRLDLNGHFPTSTTDPQPMGKVGQVFHPNQDRIVSVRECARAQGFPDDFQFWGNVHNKHRQIGNAVPPPLAASLGNQLRKALEAKAKADGLALLEGQM